MLKSKTKYSKYAKGTWSRLNLLDVRLKCLSCHVSRMMTAFPSFEVLRGPLHFAAMILKFFSYNPQAFLCFLVRGVLSWLKCNSRVGRKFICIWCGFCAAISPLQSRRINSMPRITHLELYWMIKGLRTSRHLCAPHHPSPRFISRFHISSWHGCHQPGWVAELEKTAQTHTQSRKNGVESSGLDGLGILKFNTIVNSHVWVACKYIYIYIFFIANQLVFWIPHWSFSNGCSIATHRFGMTLSPILNGLSNPPLTPSIAPKA